MEDKYPLWDYRHPDYFEITIQDHVEDGEKNGYCFFPTVAHQLFNLIKVFQSIYDFDDTTENMESWYALLESNLQDQELIFKLYVSDLVQEYKSRNDYEAYQLLCNDLITLKAEFNYSKSKLIWESRSSMLHEYYEFTWKDETYIASREMVARSYNEDLLKLKQYMDDLNPLFEKFDIIPFKKAEYSAFEIDKTHNVTPYAGPNDATETAGDDLTISPKRGTLSFQYNVAKELEIIELIQKRYKDVNGEHIGPKEIGEILSDLFKHGKPEQWSKVHGQYKTGSSNDTYKSDEQKKILKNFLTKNRLKK